MCSLLEIEIWHSLFSFVCKLVVCKKETQQIIGARILICLHKNNMSFNRYKHVNLMLLINCNAECSDLE